MSPAISEELRCEVRRLALAVVKAGIQAKGRESYRPIAGLS